jgi:muramoyltetrapeptide carboxypeptidase
VLDDAAAMDLALAQARLAAELGEVPVGAVVLDAGGRLLAVGHNRTILDRDPTAHAEVVALRAAARLLDNYRLSGARLVVTLEPCAMCLGAMFHARLAEIVYGAADPKTGACGGVVDLSLQPRLNHHATVRGGGLADACGELLRIFFRARRLAARDARRGNALAAGVIHPEAGRPAAALAHPSSSIMKKASPATASSEHGRAAQPAPAPTGADAHHAAHTHWACPDGDVYAHHHHHEAPSGIYLISPSGAVPDPAVLEMSVRRLKAMGYRVTVDRTACAVHERFAGTDKQRLACIQRALKQKHPVVMATRGGYGLSRLLPFIDWRAVADSGKTFIGQSDFTAFSLALLAQTGAVSLAGPTALHDFGGKSVDDLTMMASLVGTPYLPDVQGGILFLEDIAEHPFRVERMLTQLWHAGVLQKQHAIVLGHFTDYRLAAHDNGYDLPAVVSWLRKTVKIPVVTGLPFGHVKVKATLPIGARVGIATEDGMAHLVLQEHEH